MKCTLKLHFYTSVQYGQSYPRHIFGSKLILGFLRNAIQTQMNNENQIADSTAYKMKIYLTLKLGMCSYEK